MTRRYVSIDERVSTGGRKTCLPEEPPGKWGMPLLGGQQIFDLSPYCV